MRLTASLSLAICLLLSAGLSAQPAIVSVTPSSGPVTGGTTVTIHGSGFSPAGCIICTPAQPPSVTIGGEPATEVTFIDESTVTAVTPPHLPADATVYLHQYNGGGGLAKVFHYEGNPTDAFDRILLPVYLEPVRGAYGSEFHTELASLNSGSRDLAVWGLGYNCGPYITLCAGIFPLETPGILSPGAAAPDRLRDGQPGRFIYVVKERSADLHLNLRVFDVSRNQRSFGTEMPIPHDGDFRADGIVLLGVPVDSRFRNTLRIYSSSQSPVTVSIGLGDGREVILQPGRDLFEPAYAVFTDFPAPPPDMPEYPRTTTLQLRMLEPAGSRIWAFVTTTNIDTQEITTITPR